MTESLPTIGGVVSHAAQKPQPETMVGPPALIAISPTGKIDVDGQILSEPSLRSFRSL